MLGVGNTFDNIASDTGHFQRYFSMPRNIGKGGNPSHVPTDAKLNYPNLRHFPGQIPLAWERENPFIFLFAGLQRF